MRTLTVVDREAVIAAELARLGDHEQPMGSNHTSYGRFMGTDGMAWCAAFQSERHYTTLGFSPFPATSDRGSASCFAIASWARRTGHWIPADQPGQRGDLALLKYRGDSIEHHIRLVLTPHGVNDYDYVAGNESDLVKLGRGRTSLSGYVRLGYVDVPAAKPTPAPPAPPAGPIDLGSPPVLAATLAQGSHDAAGVKYLQKGLNVVLFLWRTPVHLQEDGLFGTETLVALQAFKQGANNKQWQHAPDHQVDQRLFVDVHNGLAGPKTLQFLRLFVYLGS